MCVCVCVCEREREREREMEGRGEREFMNVYVCAHVCVFVSSMVLISIFRGYAPFFWEAVSNTHTHTHTHTHMPYSI